jgi:hypothetical protein
MKELNVDSKFNLKLECRYCQHKWDMELNDLKYECHNHCTMIWFNCQHCSFNSQVVECSIIDTCIKDLESFEEFEKYGQMEYEVYPRHPAYCRSHGSASPFYCNDCIREKNVKEKISKMTKGELEKQIRDLVREKCIKLRGIYYEIEKMYLDPKDYQQLIMQEIVNILES